MLGEEVSGSWRRRTLGRLGWSVLALVSIMLGLAFIVGVLTTGEGAPVSPAFFITFAIFLIVCGVGLLLIKSIGPMRSAAVRRIRRTSGLGDVAGAPSNSARRSCPPRSIF